MKNKFYLILNFLLAQIVFGQTNSGWNIMDCGGFEKISYNDQETAPGMVLVEGETYLDEDAQLKSVKRVLAPFFIGINEETNGQYLAYLNFIKKVYSKATYVKALPDTTVWLKEHLSDSVKNYLYKNYFRDPAFKDYPVVGVSPDQVIKYAIWKSDRVNERILIREGLLDFYDPVDSINVFSTQTYLAGKWSGQLRQKLPSFDETNPERDVRMEDGIFLPAYRMVTLSEWLQAAEKDMFKNIVKPSKAANDNKFDKKNVFGYLFTKPQKPNKKNYIYLSGIRLFAVYNTIQKEQILNGLYDNVSEWVVDSMGNYLAIGDSWRDDYRSYKHSDGYLSDVNFYYQDRSYLDTLMKKYPDDFTKMPQKRAKVSAAVGFRLAMDYIGPITTSTLRRKR